VEKESIMKITARTNGPLLVEGETQLIDQNGKAYVLQNAMKFALCRCGGSSKKPFCDGTHANNGFQCPPQVE
jgi:CDGSH-type Zn-finger protein